VTSFSPDLYRASGRRLLESFRVVQQPGILLSCYERTRPDDLLCRRRPFEFYDLDRDDFLQTWLQDNRDVIPKHLGGATTICGCKDAHLRHSRFHKRGCHWHWMNRNASRFFRKVASLRRAAELADELGTPWLVWLDSDCYFVQSLPLSYLNDKLRDVALFHFRGHREATESGIVGYHLERGGRRFIEALCERYTSREYLKYHRWDDGFHFADLVDKGIVKSRDLAHPSKWRKKTEDVIPTTDIREYLAHEKGRNGQHGSDGGVML